VIQIILSSIVEVVRDSLIVVVLSGLLQQFCWRDDAVQVVIFKHGRIPGKRLSQESGLVLRDSSSLDLSDDREGVLVGADSKLVHEEEDSWVLAQILVQHRVESKLQNK
jgi:hypothetical protein